MDRQLQRIGFRARVSECHAPECTTASLVDQFPRRLDTLIEALPMTTVASTDLAHWRMRNLHLTGPPFATPEEVVRWLGARLGHY